MICTTFLYFICTRVIFIQLIIFGLKCQNIQKLVGTNTNSWPKYLRSYFIKVVNNFKNIQNVTV